MYHAEQWFAGSRSRKGLVSLSMQHTGEGGALATRVGQVLVEVADHGKHIHRCLGSWLGASYSRRALG